jgi:chemotaxis-related protein WspB
MLFLIFKIGDETYAIKAETVVEVVDLVNFTKIPQTPEYISGLMNYRGSILPVIDLPHLLLGKKYNSMLSTRIILIDFVLKREKNTLGIIAENLTETRAFDKKNIKKSGIQLNTIPYLGRVISDNNEIIHILDIQKILPEDLSNSLFNKK